MYLSVEFTFCDIRIRSASGMEFIFVCSQSDNGTTRCIELRWTWTHTLWVLIVRQHCSRMIEFRQSDHKYENSSVLLMLFSLFQSEKWTQNSFISILTPYAMAVSGCYFCSSCACTCAILFTIGLKCSTSARVCVWGVLAICILFSGLM